MFYHLLLYNNNTNKDNLTYIINKINLLEKNNIISILNENYDKVFDYSDNIIILAKNILIDNQIFKLNDLLNIVITEKIYI